MTDTEQLAPEEGGIRSEEAAAVSGLFGRDMVYLAFWASQIILAAALTPATTRLMGNTAFGQVWACVSVTQLLNCLFSFSLYTAVQRAYPREDGDNQARRILAMAVALSFITGAIAYATGPWWCPLIGLGPFPQPVRYAVLWAVMAAITRPAMGLVRSRDQLRGFMVGSFVQSVFAQVLALVLVVVVASTASEYLLGQLIGETLTAIIALAITRPKLPSRIHVPMLADALRYSSALVPAMIATFVFDASDRLVIHADLGADATGRYAVARSMGGFALVLIQLVGFVWLPRLFRIRDKSTRRTVLATGRDGLYMLVLAFVLALSAASPLLLRLWAPPSFKPDSLLLITALIAACAIPATATMISTQTLIVIGRTKSVALTTVGTAILNLGLNLLLVPTLGIDGSAAITFFCYMVSAVATRLMAGSDAPPTNVRPLVAVMIGTVVCIALAGVPTSGPALVGRLLVTVGAGVFFCVRLAALIAPGFHTRLMKRLGRGAPFRAAR